MPITPIKIAGYGAITACGNSADSSILQILSGKSGISFLPGATYPQAHNPLKCATDKRATLLASLAIDQALTNWSLDKQRQTALVLSTAKGEIATLEKVAAGQETPLTLPQELAEILRQRYDLAQNPLVISNACASGLIAIAQGMRLIMDGDFDHVMVAGVDLCTDFVVSGFGCLRALSDQLTTPYDANHKGLNLGEGAGAILLTRDNECPALGYLEGFGITNDANHITGPSRTGDGLAAAMQKALDMAGLEAEAIDLLNGHGTGTKYNDDMEILAIKTVFPQKTPPLFSYKGYIGHTIGAAGVIEAALTLALIKEGKCPASMGFTANEQLPAQITIPVQALNMPDLKRVFAFKAGFGGINAALIIAGGRCHE